MQTDKKLFDDMARFANALVGTLVGMRQEVSQQMRQRVERMLTDLDLVAREEFDAVKAMAEKARRENERLAERLAKLEASLKPARAAAAKSAGRNLSTKTRKRSRS